MSTTNIPVDFIEQQKAYIQFFNSLTDLQKAQELWQLVLGTAWWFLQNCKTFQMEELRTQNPTYSNIAEIMGQVAEILKKYVDDIDPMVTWRSSDFCTLMSKIGEAINSKNEEELESLIAQLKERSFICTQIQKPN